MGREEIALSLDGRGRREARVRVESVGVSRRNGTPLTPPLPQGEREIVQALTPTLSRRGEGSAKRRVRGCLVQLLR